MHNFTVPVLWNKNMHVRSHSGHMKWVTEAQLHWQNRDAYRRSLYFCCASYLVDFCCESLSANTLQHWLSVNCSTLAGAHDHIGWWQWKSSGLCPAQIKTQQKQLWRQRHIISRCVFPHKVRVWLGLIMGFGRLRADIYSIGFFQFDALIFPSAKVRLKDLQNKY